MRPTPLWVIEGFYGDPWPRNERLLTIKLLGGWGYGAYIYAPKADRSLRRAWARPFTQGETSALAELAEGASESGIAFGAGLSPFEIWQDWSRDSRAALKSKIHALAAIGAQKLCLLFDDMRGDLPNLAALQGEVVAFVKETAPGLHLVVCPTYYAADPVLEKVFGKAPANYLADLGAALPEEADIFWTGPKVVSDEISSAHIEETASLLGRQPFLWDNYPVNDGARTSRFLFLEGAKSRGHLMRGALAGYAANPMVQPRLSQLPLHALTELRRDPSGYDRKKALVRAAQTLLPKKARAAFLADAESFAALGLDGLGAKRRAGMMKRYAALPGPHAAEVVRWLSGAYAFDPGCLTD